MTIFILLIKLRTVYLLNSTTNRFDFPVVYSEAEYVQLLDIMKLFQFIIFLFHYVTLWFLRILSPAANLARTSFLLQPLRGSKQHYYNRSHHDHSHDHQNKTVPIKLRGLNYSPRQGPDSWGKDKCKSVEKIRSEFRILTQLTDKFHLYSLAECSQAEIIIPIAKEMGFKLFLNLWVNSVPLDDPSGSFTIEMNELDSLLDKGMIDSNTVLAISVGSESYHRRETTIDTDILYFNIVKDKLQMKTETKHIPMTVTDVDKTYVEYPELLSAVDFASVNAFPFFDPAYGREDATVDSSRAVDFLTKTLLSPLFNECVKVGKPLYLTETGW